MKFVKLLLAVALASAQDKEISSTSESKETVKTLFKANDTQLDYTFKTVLETYTDNSKARFLHGELVLSGVRTYYASDPVDGVHDEIRVSVGWRNPEEDGYDVTSFAFMYDTDQSKITKDKVEAVDGYSVGSIDSFYYNWEHKDKDDLEINKGYNYITDVSTFDTEFTSEVGQDCYGGKNVTIKQWTDKKNKDGTVDYRVAEVNDITILDVSVSDRPSTVDIPESASSAEKNKVVQTFTVSYKRPFKASELSDINLEAGEEYNITSAYGCYKGSTGQYDPDSLSDTKETVLPAVVNDIGIASGRESDFCDGDQSLYTNNQIKQCTVITTYDTSGCFGAWQATEGIMVWSQPYKKEVSGNQIWTERSISGVLMSKSNPKNGNSEDITGMVETQITVLLLENAKNCLVGVLSIISVFASIY